MMRTTWLLLFALHLPPTNPVRARAVEVLSLRLAESYRASLEEKKRAG